MVQALCQLFTEQVFRGSADTAALRDAMIAARKNAGMSQLELADHLGRPQSFVAKVEIGERCLGVVEFVAIARILEADVAQIVAMLEAQLAE